MIIIIKITFPVVFQNLHRDIESNSQLIKTVLWQCGELDAQRRHSSSCRKKKSTAAKRISVLLSVGKIIEERWHCLWLRSLEWQCFLEQFTSCIKVIYHALTLPLCRPPRRQTAMFNHFTGHKHVKPACKSIERFSCYRSKCR